MRSYAAGLCALAVTGCTAFPRSPEQARVDIRSIVDSIECELAAVATSDDPDVRSRDIMKWNASADVDLNLVRSIGVGGDARVTAPAGLGVVSATPKLGGSDADTRTNSISFAISFQNAVTRFGNSCSGPNPSETNMGLAYWFEGSVKAVGKDSLISISFTKQFQIVANAGARFGYILTPVTNTVVADAGGDVTFDYKNRFTIALTPPAPKPKPPKPIPVYVVDWQRSKEVTPPPPTPKFKKEGEMDLIRPQVAPPVAEKRPAPRVRRATQPEPSPRERALNDPELQRMLQRQSPVTLAPQ